MNDREAAVDAIIAGIEKDAAHVDIDEIMRIESMTLDEALASISGIIALEMASPLARGYCYRLLAEIAYR
jgi:hypothetical protein